MRVRMLILGLALLLPGCGDDDLVVGHWLSERLGRERPVSIEFAANGSFELTDASGVASRGQWGRSADNTLTLDFPDKASCTGKLSAGGKDGLSITSCTFEGMTKRMQGDFYRKDDVERSELKLACKNINAWARSYVEVRALKGKDVMCFDYVPSSCASYIGGKVTGTYSIVWYERVGNRLHEFEISKRNNSTDYELRMSPCGSLPGQSNVCITSGYSVLGSCSPLN